MLYRTMGMYVYNNVYVCIWEPHDRVLSLYPSYSGNGSPSTKANTVVRWVTVDEIPDIAFNMYARWTGISQSHADVRVHRSDHSAVY